MKLNPQEITSALNTGGVALADRGYLVSIAFAKAAAYRLPLPTSPVENPTLYFITRHKADLLNLVSPINEEMVVDIPTICDLTQRLWIFRYRLVYDLHNPTVRQFCSAAVKVGSRELPPKLSEWLIKYESNDLLEMIIKKVDGAFTEGQLT